MTYSVLPSVSPGDTIASATWGNIVKADIEYLLGRPKGSTFRDNNGNYTTTSTSFVDVDATNLKQTITISGSTVLVGFSGSIITTDVGNVGHVCFDIDVDGTRAGTGGTDGVMMIYDDGNASRPANASFTVLITGLTAGSHTFKLQWRVNNSANTAALTSGSGSGGTDNKPNLYAVEVG